MALFLLMLLLCYYSYPFFSLLYFLPFLSVFISSFTSSLLATVVIGKAKQPILHCQLVERCIIAV